jgi:hypothetical protein
MARGDTVDDERRGAEGHIAAGQDDVLLARLAEMFRADDGPPAVVVELAKQSFGLRTVDAELAALTADSDLDLMAVAVRLGNAEVEPRLLTFEAAGTAVEIEVHVAGRDRRVVGQLIPSGPARIEVRQPAAPEPRSVEADHQGRFVVENVHPGPISLTCHRPGQRPVGTEWTRL